MKVITIDALRQIVERLGQKAFMREVIAAQEEDMGRWDEFQKSPRHAVHYPHGVIELMPCADDTLYAFKYVNGHPKNTREGKLSVIALGLLTEVDSGYPLMLSEMTLLTAFRTAATTALGAKYLARANSQHLALIGTGAQAEFQLLACQSVLPLHTVSYYDCDPQAMDKFAIHAQTAVDKLIPCTDIAEAVAEADMVITATAAKKKNRLLSHQMVRPGTHINGLGGDCPGKTELDPALLDHCKIVVEYLEQSREEGEIQNLGGAHIHGELRELINGSKPGRENDQEITLLDSVGFALEDFSILRLVYRLAQELQIGHELELMPSLSDPKNLFSLLKVS
ncbi:MAG: ornithine cyclodeaminase [Chromatiales bacterium]|nr:ornithine cyclodeaminase [Chromatiales bacterium]